MKLNPKWLQFLPFPSALSPCFEPYSRAERLHRGGDDLVPVPCSVVLLRGFGLGGYSNTCRIPLRNHPRLKCLTLSFPA